MANKAIPIVALGAAAVFLLPKKKKKQKTGASSDIVSSGSIEDWKWRVRNVKTTGFADQFFGEVQSPNSKSWSLAHEQGQSDPNNARLLAMEAIGIAIAGGQGNDGVKIHSSGESNGVQWRVIEATPVKGFGTGYFGEAKISGSWSRCHDGVHSKPNDARLLCLEAIAKSKL